MSNRGIRRICGNIYDCREAARLLKAQSLSLQKDRCGSCDQESTYPEFMRHGLILSCRMCAHLSNAQGRVSGNTLGDCFKGLGRHCPICAFEYASLNDRDDAWIMEAGKVVRCFLGGVGRHELAERFFDLLHQMGCSQLERYLTEVLAILEDKKRIALKQRIREAGKILGLDLLGESRAGQGRAAAG